MVAIGETALNGCTKRHKIVADIAQWNSQRLPSCGPWFESQAQHFLFFNFYYRYIFHFNFNVKRTEMNKKEARIGPNLKKRQKDQCIMIL